MKRVIVAALVIVFILATVLMLVPSAHAATYPGAPLSGTPLGVNVSPWQTADPSANARMNASLKALGPVFLRWGGGTYADGYDETTNRNTYHCRPETDNFYARCSYSDPLSFPASMVNAKALRATVMPIANYGSGTPAMAAYWAKQAIRDHDPVSSFEIGNEPYGCASIIIPLTKPPANDFGYEPSDPVTCPYKYYGSTVAGLQMMGRSYLTYAPAIINAIKAASPGAKIILPYAISPKGNDGWAWNQEVMPRLKNYDGIAVLWYPSYSAISLTPAVALNALRTIPLLARGVRADLAKYAPGKPWQIAEENVTNHANTDVCQPVSAVFSAGSALSWLVAGAQNVNWWEQSDNNNSNRQCKVPDFAMFDSTGYPQNPYWGFLLASKLAQPHAVLANIGSGSPNVLEFHAQLKGGHQAVAYINISTTASAKVKGYPLPRANLPTFRYSIAHPYISVTHMVTPATVTTAPGSVTVFTD